MAENGQNLLDVAANWRRAGCPLRDGDVDLLGLLLEGLRVREIADRRETTVDTVYGHLADARTRLGVPNWPQAAIICVFAGWLEVQDIESGRVR